MFDWALFLLIIAVCLPGVLIVVPRTLRTALKRLPADRRPPPTPLLIAISALQSLVFIAAASAAGTGLAQRAGLAAPFFQALASGGAVWNALQPQLLLALIAGVSGGLVFTAAYYLFFRPRLDAQTVSSMEGLRMGLGIWGRVLYGGIAEEVITRWGLMTFIVWLGVLIAGSANAAVVWTAIVISGVLFGLGHLPNYIAAGCRRTPMFIALTISLNLLASLISGWLFWQYGLLAAMLAHALFHIVWWPFDRHFYQLESEPE